MAVTLGDTRAPRTLGNTSSALPQWNSTLVKPSRREMKGKLALSGTFMTVWSDKNHFVRLQLKDITAIYVILWLQKKMQKRYLELSVKSRWSATFEAHVAGGILTLLDSLPLSVALTLASSTASWHSSIPITFFTRWKPKKGGKMSKQTD